MNRQIIIIGGGASALMLASLLPKNRATIIESNAKVAAKIHISGGGKCNITNKYMGGEYFLAKHAFVESILNVFDEKKLLLWLKKEGLNPILRKKTHYFCENSSTELIDIFKKKIKHQRVLLSEKVIEVTKRGAYFKVKTQKRILSAKYVVVASGGLSFPKLGASGIGYEIASSFGHTIKQTAPALVGFTVQKEQFFFKTLSGSSTKVSIRVDEQIFQGDLLFTHKGISGPAVLDSSLYWQKGSIEINFLPHFSLEHMRGSKKQISSLLPIPKRITKAFLVQLGLEDKPFFQLTFKELEKLQSLQQYVFAPAGTFGYSKAEVTKGGVCTDEVDAKTMMSLKEEGLYFIGEVLDVTGKLGGYNFQWAFSSAFVCHKNIRG